MCLGQRRLLALGSLRVRLRHRTRNLYASRRMCLGQRRLLALGSVRVRLRHCLFHGGGRVELRHRKLVLHLTLHLNGCSGLGGCHRSLHGLRSLQCRRSGRSPRLRLRKRTRRLALRFLHPVSRRSHRLARHRHRMLRLALCLADRCLQGRNEGGELSGRAERRLLCQHRHRRNWSREERRGERAGPRARWRCLRAHGVGLRADVLAGGDGALRLLLVPVADLLSTLSKEQRAERLRAARGERVQIRDEPCSRTTPQRVPKQLRQLRIAVGHVRAAAVERVYHARERREGLIN